MTSIIDLRSIASKRLNSLSPHSRKRAGYEDLLRHLTAEQLRIERDFDEAFVAELDAELARICDDPVFLATAGLV